MRPRKSMKMRVAAALATVAAATLIITGCAGSGASSSSRYLNVYSGNPGNLTDNFNPFVADVAYGANGAVLGAVYEPLFYFNSAKNEKPQPWLGTEYTVSPDGLTYTVTLRDGVKWQDGKPFTAADVAYTYNLLEKKPELNLYGLKIAEAKAVDDTHVTITLSQPDYPNEYRLLGLTFIVPEHIWSSISDPAKTTNQKPIGTGAFDFGQFTPQSVTLTANKDYYQKGQPAIPGIRLVTSTGNAAALNSLNAGQIDWAGIALQDVQKSFVDKDKKYNKYTSIPADIKVLMPNLSKAPFDDLAFRQALSLSIDRDAIIKQAFGGTDTPANPTSLLQPRDEAYIPADYTGKTLDQDVDKAKKILTDAGYSYDGSGNLIGKDGQPVKFKITTVTGYTDTITANQLLVQDFQKIGVQATPEELSLGAYSTARQNGSFDLLDDRIPTGPNPFQQFSDSLDSAKTAPVGKPANANFVRFQDPKVDQLIAQAGGTNDPAQLTSAYQALGTYFAENQPYIILSQNGAVTTYRDQYFTGMPTPDNLWATPSNWLSGNIGYVAKSLKPVK
ncbi:MULTISPECIES: ABC transporter substrate-binding protein [unclassified Leifsonia]|uniref:ABC transporter substrate-binding protein n=1 Tax=unclassified Leifsonia TaxID=2663824 RepID=UPI0003A3C31E|nr:MULTISPECIES: ABC transporter substrate-binding protein [unclassified Leifsonia]TDQ02655.1 peptide/nickel transport system substrate-binding protein [Leifsonia sp. 115AMFTsu3.1]